jgi:hypothetical protein
VKCARCGCTNEAPCILDEDGQLVDVQDGTIAYDIDAAGLHPCYWVEDKLCSGCVVNPPPPLLYDAGGQPLRGTP